MRQYEHEVVHSTYFYQVLLIKKARCGSKISESPIIFGFSASQTTQEYPRGSGQEAMSSLARRLLELAPVGLTEPSNAA